MATRRDTFRVFSAETPSSALCASLCAQSDPRSDVQDVLLLTSDYYTGGQLAQYRQVMEALAGGHAWAQIEWYDGVGRALEYVGTGPRFASRWHRLRIDAADARRFQQWLETLLGRLIIVEEIWVDGSSYVARFLFNRYRSARKVLYPHQPLIFWGARPVSFSIPAWRGTWRPTIARAIRRWATPKLPMALTPRLAEVCFDRAYTFRGEKHLAAEVIHAPHLLNRGALRRAFERLPTAAKSALQPLGQPGPSGARASLMFLPGSRSPHDFSRELDALCHLLHETRVVRRDGPVIVKPHPACSEAYLQRMLTSLQSRVPHTEFRPLDSWMAVPTEVAASVWDISCSLGLLTAATGVMRWLFGVPGYCSATALRALYRDDPFWAKELELFLGSDGQWLTFV